MRVQLIDPSADVLPYDHALAAALARRGTEVELVTSRFVHGTAPARDGYEVSESFYRLATRLGRRRAPLRRALKAVEHMPGTVRLRRRAATADLQHWQWLWLEALSTRLLPRARPQVLTMHNVIRRGRSGRRLAERMDATIVHTRRGAELLGGGPGVDVLIDAFRSVEGAELWVVGRPLGVSLEQLGAPPGVRFVPRYVSDAELPAFFRRADLLVLPHRTVDVSGVLAAGLAFGKPMVLSDAGGFRELVEEHGAGRLVPPGDPGALAEAIAGLLADPAERERLAERARVAAAEPDGWAREPQRLDLSARRHGLPLVPEAELYASPPAGVDLVVSFLYPRLIREPVLSLGRIGCLNFHPAPLPDFRGVGGYNRAVPQGPGGGGGSCPLLDEPFHTRDLRQGGRFRIDPDAHTALSLDLESGDRLVGLCGRIMDRALSGEELPREPQGEGRYVSRAELEELRLVRPGDDVARKLRAFWYPPWPGALGEVAGGRYTLVDERLLAE